MPNNQNQNTPSSVDIDPIPVVETGVNTLEAVADLQRQEAEEKAKLVATEKKESVDEVQANLKKNKALFYGLPILVLTYGVLAVFFFIVPSIQTYFSVNAFQRTLDNNLTVLRSTAANLSEARNNISEYDQYQLEVTSYIPTDSQLGGLIDNIQKKAGDSGLESQVGLPSAGSVSNNSTIGNIAARDADDNALFDSINSGEIEFIPGSVLNPESRAKLLAIDVNIKGNKENFFKFLRDMESSKPIINLVYVDYQEVSTNLSSGNSEIRATLRFESYTLKLGEENNQITKLNPTDPSLLTPMLVETFELNPEIVEEFRLDN
jgi:Tfp pilus assembly protein PilO